jgi:hypothetical protein
MTIVANVNVNKGGDMFIALIIATVATIAVDSGFKMKVTPDNCHEFKSCAEHREIKAITYSEDN